MRHFIFYVFLKFVSWLIYGVWLGGSWCEVLGSGVYNVSEFTTLWLEVRVSKSIVFIMVSNRFAVLCFLYVSYFCILVVFRVSRFRAYDSQV